MKSAAQLSKPLLLVFVMLLASLSPLAGATPVNDAQPAILIEGLSPLQCADGNPCDTPIREPSVPADATPGVEAWGWWHSYSPDRDANGMDDRLQRIIAGEYESVSPTAITGPDGKQTVAIHVDFAWHPGPADMATLTTVLNSHDWVGPALSEGDGGAWFEAWDSLDTVSIDKVPVSALLDIWSIDGVVVVEQQNVMAPFLSVSVPAMKVGVSGDYEDTPHQFSQRGDGVVVAVLDTGVDNEHRSLNDFDDVNDAPDLDANSYTDQKWVAGFDATSTFSSPNGTDDPDDTAGHGTHVAGTAVGTGSSDRVEIGVAPGAFLVDVKVLTDAGGTNAQASLNGIQWSINNVNTDWGNNDSSNGIDVLSMSFGSVSNPQSDDPGDNGSSAEARLVDQATATGLVCVIAMGNDGMRRVPSPASADTSLAVAALHEQSTVNRDDDTHASYSNWGPREDDGDSNEWDELKPDVIAPGSGIRAARHQEGSAVIPGQPRPMADNEYQSMDGTSMATPHVSGMVAIMLSEDEDLEPLEIRDLFRNHSEARGDAHDASPNGAHWNERYGFGIVDGVALMAEVAGGNSSSGGDPPPVSGTGDFVNITSPTNHSWLIAGETYRIRGTADTGMVGNDVEEVRVLARYRHYQSESGEGTYEWRPLLDWSEATFTSDDEWLIHLDVELWQDGAQMQIQAKGRDSTDRWSNSSWVDLFVGELDVSLIGPSGQSSLSGDVIIDGTFKGADVLPSSIEWRVGRGAWQTGALGSSEVDCRGCDVQWDCDYRVGDWSAQWDSTTVSDGEHTLAVRLVNVDGVHSDEVRRRVVVDNLPPAPEMAVHGSINVEEWGVPVSEAMVQSQLGVSFSVRNNGDAVATDVIVVLRENGAKRAEANLPSVGVGEVHDLILYWNPQKDGVRSLEVVVDPANELADNDRGNNLVNFPFTVNPPVDGVDLAVREGAIRTTPEVPRPAEPHTVSVRVDNLGAQDSGETTVFLESRGENGLWSQIASMQMASILSQSNAEINFPVNQSDAVGVEYRVKVQTTTDLDMSNNIFEFTVVQDDVILSGAVNPEVGAEYIVDSIGVADKTLVFTRDGSALQVSLMDDAFGIYNCLDLETDFAGTLAVNAYDGVVTAVWTRTYMDEFGFTRTTVSYTTIDRTCTMTPKQDLMDGLLASEGTYWGLDIDQSGDHVVIAGYHRDLFTGGSYNDVTSIFTLSTHSPLSASDWSLTTNVILDVELSHLEKDPLQVEIGEDWLHLLYQSTREDSTGISRLGVFYAHGAEGASNWAFKVAAGDDAGLAQLAVQQDGNGADTIIALWREGSGADAQVAAHIGGSDWFSDETELVPARGIQSLHLLEAEDGLQVVYDRVSPTGPKILYGRITLGEDGGLWMADTIATGELETASRCEGELRFLYGTIGGLRVRALIDDTPPPAPSDSLLDTIRLMLGLDRATFDALTKVLVACWVMFTLLLLVVIVGGRRRRSRTAEVSVVLEDDDDIDLSELDEFDHDEGAELAEVPLSATVDDGPAVQIEPDVATAMVDHAEASAALAEAEGDGSSVSARRARREMRAAKKEMDRITAEMAEKMAESGLPPLPAPGEMPAPGELPPLPLPGELPSPADLPPLPLPGELPAPGDLPPLPDLPAPEIPVTCTSCETAFTARANSARRVKCPICSETVLL